MTYILSAISGVRLDIYRGIGFIIKALTDIFLYLHSLNIFNKKTMEIIPEEVIEIYHNFYLAESTEQFKEDSQFYKDNQRPLGDYIYKHTEPLSAISKEGTTFRLLWTVMRSYKYYSLTIPTITIQKVNYIDSIWKQRMRSHRDASREDLMTYIKTEIKQTFMVEFIFKLLNDEVELPNYDSNYFVIEDKEFLIRSYVIFFTLIDLMDEAIEKVLEIKE